MTIRGIAARRFGYYRGNYSSRTDPARGSRKCPPAPANPRNDKAESPARAGNPRLLPLRPETR